MSSTPTTTQVRCQSERTGAVDSSPVEPATTGVASMRTQ